jgi:hypothetical protein
MDELNNIYTRLQLECPRTHNGYTSVLCVDPLARTHVLMIAMLRTHTHMRFSFSFFGKSPPWTYEGRAHLRRFSTKATLPQKYEGGINHSGQ